MHTRELARQVAEAEGVMNSVVERLIDVMVEDALAAVAAGKTVAWPKFGKFAAVYKKPRIYRTPEERKRAARPGEGADKFVSISLPLWVFAFYPSRYFKNSVRATNAPVPAAKQYDGVSTAFIKRIAGQVDLSSVEVAALVARIVKVVTTTVTAGGVVTFGGMGIFYSKKRAARFFEVQKKGGGREKRSIAARTVPAFQRTAGEAGGP